MDLLDGRGDNPAVTLQKLSIESIARQAGVSKMTIYRWWPNKAAIVIDSFMDNHLVQTPVRQDGPALDALREHLVSLSRIYSGPEGRLISQLIAECQYDAATLAEFKDRFWKGRVAAALSLIERAMVEGELASDLDPRLVAEALYAPIYFRLLFQTGELDRGSTEALFDALLSGLAPH